MMSSTNTILVPTPEIRTACDLMDEAIARFLPVMGRAISLDLGLGRFESSNAALSLFKLCIRSVEGVLALARTDLVLLPAALMVSRGAFETSVKAAWLLDCDDPYARERRWLQLLAGEERTHERVAGHLKKAGVENGDSVKRASDLKSFREAIERRFPGGYPALPGMPSMEQMMTTLHDPQLYVAYVYLSQFLHGERIASSFYGPAEEFRRDAVTPANWSFPLKICWLAFFRGGRKLIERLGGDPDEFMSEGEEVEVRNALAMI